MLPWFLKVFFKIFCMIFLVRGRQSGHLFMYVRFVIDNGESHLSFFQKRSSFVKNRVNSKFYMGKIGATHTKFRCRNAVIYLVDLGIEQSMFFSLSDK